MSSELDNIREELQKEEDRVIQFAERKGLNLMAGYMLNGEDADLAHVMGQLYVIRKLKWKYKND